MPRVEFVGFGSQVTGNVNYLLIDEDKACAPTQNLIGYLAGAILNYKDEGVVFAPSIIICDKLADILKALPGAVSHTIGIGDLDPASGPKILKDCAPLSGDSWSIFIERNNGKSIRYGIFTYLRLPTAISLRDSLILNKENFCILLRKSSENTIEIQGSKGNDLSLSFSATRERKNQEDPVDQFTISCCAGIKEHLDDYKSYLKNLLHSTLGNSHGTILICTKRKSFSHIPNLKDAIVMSPVLDLYAAFKYFRVANTSEAIVSLQRCEDLLIGFHRCDGAISFNGTGQITAYRIFFRSNTKTLISGTAGGSRRRAFEGMKALAGRHLTASLFRSQDGLTIYHGAA